MGKNTGNGTRIGLVKNRTQSYNSATGQYVKRDSETGRIMGCKKTPFKAIRVTNKDKCGTAAPKKSKK